MTLCAEREADVATALAHQKAGRLDEAATLWRDILAACPDHGEAQFQLGCTLGLSGHPEAAVACFRHAVRLMPDRAAAHFNLGRTLYQLGRNAEAIDCYRHVLRLTPDTVGARLDVVLMRLPIIYRDVDHLGRARADYGRALRALDRRPIVPDTGATAFGSVPPFYLAYQGRNDRGLQQRYGGLIARLAAAAYPQWAMPPEVAPPGPAEPIRVGILSAYFHYHSNWKAPIQGWLAGLDRSRFEIHGYHLGYISDAVTAEAASLCHRFTKGPKTVAEWAAAIRADDLHVLLIPGIGMDPLTGTLAALRLAPVQAAGLGHPVTTGLPTIDHYLSSDLMEPPGAQGHYSETLVRLPNLGFWYEPPRIEPAPLERSALGLADDDIVYWCCQSLYKYLPQHDWIFAAIAKAVPKARLVFVAYPHGDAVTETFRERLAVAFAQAGLDAGQHCRILPFLAPAFFARMARLADVFLDGVTWSGFNSALEAIDADLPIVTWRGRFMRGRHAAAFLTMMDMEALIAPTEKNLAGLAIALGLDADFRRAASAHIAANKHRLYRDQAAIDGLAAYLERAAASIGATPP